MASPTTQMFLVYEEAIRDDDGNRKFVERKRRITTAVKRGRYLVADNGYHTFDAKTLQETRFTRTGFNRRYRLEPLPS